MSIRTILEFNHDYAYEITRFGPTMAILLEIALKSGDAGVWEELESRFGIRRVSTHHHSDDRKVMVAGREIGL